MQVNIGFKIIHIDKNTKTMVIRPCSTNFKNHPESYPLLNVNMSNLNSDKDVSEQIIEMIVPTVKSIIDGETDNKISTIMKFAQENQNKVISMDKFFDLPQPTLAPQLNTIQPSTLFEVVLA